MIEKINQHKRILNILSLVFGLLLLVFIFLMRDKTSFSNFEFISLFVIFTLFLVCFIPTTYLSWFYDKKSTTLSYILKIFFVTWVFGLVLIVSVIFMKFI